MDNGLFAKIQGIFSQGAAQAGKLKSGEGSIDDAKDVRYIDNAIKNLKAEEEAAARDRGIVDMQSLSQTKEEIDAIVANEMQKMLGVSFAKNLGIEKKTDIQSGAKFSDEEISLENLMSLLDDDVDKAKVAEHNKKGTVFSDIVKAGIDDDDYAQAIVEEGDSDPAKLSAHISNPVKDQFNHVLSNANEFGDLAPLANTILALSSEKLLG